MSGALHGQVAIVTGAGSATGIGFAIAALLAEQGAKVLLAATSDRIHDRVAELTGQGLTARAFIGDLTDEQVAADLVASAEAAWGRSHLLPWMWRHATGHSSGDGREAKRAQLTELRKAE